MFQTIANRYQLQDKLGEGGMGAVYRAFDPLEQTTIALKQVNRPLEQLQFNTKASFSDERVAMVQEFRTLASLRHPNIISVLDYGFDDEQNPFFTMDLLENASTILVNGQNKSEQEKTHLLVQTLQALIYLHRRDILHRDLKPANVLVTGKGTVKVLDFGLSAKSDRVSGTAGTLAYMAPEVLREQPISRATDLYSIGMIAYELFMGKYPFKARNPMRLVRDIVQKIPNLSSITNPALEMVLMRWLMKDPEDRYQSAQSLITALCDAVEIEPPQESIAIRESFLQASAFIGRDDELQTLKDELNLVLQGATSFYLVGGESGVGKSRLLDELRTQALVSGATVIRGQAVEGGGLPFQLWRNIVRRLLLMVDVTDLQAGILKDIVPDIDRILGRKITSAPIIDGNAYQERLVLTLTTLISAVDHPVVLLLEDLQWASDNVKPLQQLLKMQTQVSHLMVIATYRNDEAPKIPDLLLNMKLIHLDRLTKSEIEKISQSMLGKNVSNDDVVTLLENETEGNLFFMIETIRALAENVGSLNDIGTSTLPASVFTGGMRQIMQSRLSKIEPSYVSIQMLAATLGREIDINLLAHHHDMNIVEAWLINASEHAVLDIQSNRWRFAHDKLRETIVQTMTPDDELIYHQYAAQSIESVYHDQLDTYAEVLANHWYTAQKTKPFLEYATIVGDKHLNTGRYAELNQLAQNMMQVSNYNSYTSLQAQYWLGEAHFNQGNWDEATKHYQNVQNNAPHQESPLLHGQAMFGLARLAVQQGRFAESIKLMQDALPITKAYADTYAYGLTFLAALLGHLNKIDQSRQYQDEALQISRQTNNNLVILGILNDRAVKYNQLGEFENAKQSLEECIHRARIIGYQWGLSIALNNMAYVLSNQGNFDKAKHHVQEGIQIARTIANPTALAANLHRSAWIYGHQGDTDNAYREADELIKLSKVLNAHNHLSGGILLNTAIAIYEHYYDQAHKQLEHAKNIIQQQPNKWFQALILFYQASLAYFENQPQQAIGHLEEATQYLQQEPVIRHKVLSKLGFLYAEIGDSKNAKQYLQQALQATMKDGQLPVLLDIFVGYANTLYQTNPQLSHQLVSFVRQQPQLSYIETDQWLQKVEKQLAKSEIGQIDTIHSYWTSLDDAIRAIRNAD